MKQITKSTKPVSEKQIKREWHLVNMAKERLGRVTNEIANLLQGKRKTTYAPYIDSGDYVVIINAKKVTLSGKKTDTKVYSYYSGYPGGLKKVSFKELIEKKPEEVIRHAVSGMLPKNKLRDRRLARLFIFADEHHPYEDKLKK
ncbi:MAG: 50S ribosomal protein L13 [Candidatus Roizmanbacteria bacterium]|nr:MAG: 50S ribosomal protein L13 [Candidatus Roizmanbacteria bacterium]